MAVTDRVFLYDTTLRDGAQTRGVDFSVADKTAIARALDQFGIDYVEGGWPGANPTDDLFFSSQPSMLRAQLAAFGMTRRAGRSVSNDASLAAVINSGAPVICLVGKAWDFQVDVALGIPREENLRLIGDSIAACTAAGREAVFDAEHFFDGFDANPDYALACLKAAALAGARWIVLCDTNGGALPGRVTEVVRHVATFIDAARLGIHAHDDCGVAVANSLAAVAAGVRMVQGTLNGLGERCGNANLITLLPVLMLKMQMETGVSAQSLTGLTRLSRLLDDRLNRSPYRQAPFVGDSAFAHKGGLHASAIARDARCYEHIDPALVGNRRIIVMSDQAGRSNVLARLAEAGIAVDPQDNKVTQLVSEVKRLEFSGITFDGAEESFELLARKALGQVPEYFRLVSFRIIDERRWGAKGKLVTVSEATIRIDVPGTAAQGEGSLALTERLMTVAEGSGPVNSLDTALRKALLPIYPILEGVRLVDYRVRILNPNDGTGAVTRVMIESRDAQGTIWRTVGVSANIIDASYNALHDALAWRIWMERRGSDPAYRQLGA